MRSMWETIYGVSTTFVCPYCLKEKHFVEASIEHEPPKSRQKELGKSQTFYVCKDCNHEKGALTAQEYAEWKRLEFIRNGGMSR